MATHFRSLLAFVFLLLGTISFAQEVPLQQTGKNEFSFSTRDMVLIRDFKLEAPGWHLSEDPYKFTITALTTEGATDTQVSGDFMFTVNGQLKEVTFANGVAQVEHQLGRASKLEVKLESTNLEKTVKVSRLDKWPAVAGVLLFLLLTFLFRHPLARFFRKLFGKN